MIKICYDQGCNDIGVLIGNCMSKALRFPQITAKHQDFPFFTLFLTIKTASQNISITFLQISLKLDEHRGRYWRKKPPWTILEEQFPVPRYTAASKMGNRVILLLWQLRCRCNPDHDKFQSLSKGVITWDRAELRPVRFCNFCTRDFIAPRKLSTLSNAHLDRIG